MLRVYRCLTSIIFPLVVILVYLRSIFKKEDRLRYKEKIFPGFFRSTRNNKNKLFWFHAASIGELLSILPLINKINNFNKNVDFLITTVTLSSSNLLKKKLSHYNNVTHRFFPVDTENLSNKFLNLWKPNLVCFVDSEIWPNFLFKIKEKKIPLILINARITKKTFYKWNVFPNFARRVFKNFDLSLASSRESRNNLRQLEVKNVKYIGNLKFTVKNKVNKLNKINTKILNKSKVWCAASTHKGEELFILKTHLEIKKKYNNILTIIIPRHINRSYDIKDLSNKFGLKSQILSSYKCVIKTDTEILIINSFGVLSGYFNYCKNVFIGKSLIKKLDLVGGQNPIEAAKLGCKIFHGPYVYNFKEIYGLLKSYGISKKINNDKKLSQIIIKNLKNPKKINISQINLLNTYGKNILNKTIVELNKYIK